MFVRDNGLAHRHDPPGKNGFYFAENKRSWRHEPVRFIYGRRIRTSAASISHGHLVLSLVKKDGGYVDRTTRAIFHSLIICTSFCNYYQSSDGFFMRTKTNVHYSLTCRLTQNQSLSAYVDVWQEWTVQEEPGTL